MALQELITNIILGLTKLGIGLGGAIGTAYIGINLLDKLTLEIDEWKELKKGNLAVGVLIAGIIIAMALMVEKVIIQLIDAVQIAPLNLVLINLAASLINLVISSVIAIYAIYLSIKIIDQATPDINEIKELKNGNVAVGLLISTAILAVALITNGTIAEIVEILNIKGILLNLFPSN